MSTPNNESRNDLGSALFGENGILLHPDIIGESAYSAVYEDLRGAFDSAVYDGLPTTDTIDILLAELDELTDTATSIRARIAQLTTPDSTTEATGMTRYTSDVAALLDTIAHTDQSSGHTLLRAVMDRFGFTGVIMGPGDAGSVWDELDEETGTEFPFDLEAVTATSAWRKGFGDDAIMEDAWEIVRDAVVEARGEVKKRVQQ